MWELMRLARIKQSYICLQNINLQNKNLQVLSIYKIATICERCRSFILLYFPLHDSRVTHAELPQL